MTTILLLVHTTSGVPIPLEVIYLRATHSQILSSQTLAGRRAEISVSVWTLLSSLVA